MTGRTMFLGSRSSSRGPVAFILHFMAWGMLFLELAHGADPCKRWDELQALIRDGLIPPPIAKEEIVRLHTELFSLYRERDVNFQKRAFPVEGCSPTDIGGRRGGGFVAKGYNFYDGNRHLGHPAHDIFIRDKDQDSRDDRSGKKVRVRAFASGVVVGVNRGWRPGSELRGGNYVWVFSPRAELYCYYAHLEDVWVEPCDWVNAGEVLGTVGRTGKNAFPSRSPTHLHFMCLEFQGGEMRPLNPYEDLLRAASIE